MTATELQTMTENSQYLPVTSIGNGVFYVESTDGKIAYRVEVTDRAITCTCADYVENGRHDPEFKCKHVLAMLGVQSDDIAVTEYLVRNKPKLADCWITNIQGNDFVKYSGLLDLAHQKGLLKLEVEIIQMPNNDNGNEAICKAVAVSRLGEVYTDIGDANPNNTAPKIAKHLLRMASTRAKARVLRDFSNIGMTALEEVDFDDVIGKGTTSRKTTGKKATVTNIATQAKKTTGRKKTSETQAAPVKEVVKPVEQSEPAKVETMPAQKKTSAKKPAKEAVSETRPAMSLAQKKAISNLAKRRGITEEELNNLVQENFNSTFEALTLADASTIIRQLQQSA